MEEQQRLTEEEIDKKTEELKQRFLQYKAEQTRVVFGNIQENKRLKNIKEKNRKRNKMQKSSRKKNR